MKSSIALPNDYVVVDLETTGVNPRWEDILELSAIRYRNGVEVSRYEQLIKPKQPIRPFISRLTGITDEMVVECPTIEDAIGDFADFIGDDVMVGHNIAGFDAVFLSYAYEQYLSKPLSNSCVDTMRISKKLCPGLPSYTLECLSSFLDVPYLGAHRGMADSEITNACYQKLKEMALANGTEDNFKDLFNKKPTRIQVSEIKPTCADIQQDHPLFNKIIVFTGAMAMTRAEAMQMAVDVGAVLKTSVTTKTDYLVVGTQDIDRVGSDGMSTKEEKAHALNESGKGHIQIITEDDFLLMARK